VETSNDSGVLLQRIDGLQRTLLSQRRLGQGVKVPPFLSIQVFLTIIKYEISRLRFTYVATSECSKVAM